MTVVEELTAQVAANEKLMEDRKADSVALEASAKSLVAMTAERDLAIKAKADAEAQVVAKVAELKTVSDAFAVEQTAHTACKSELEKAQKALANPAFAAAAAVGSKKGVAEGASEGSDAAKITKENAEAEYRKIPGTEAKARAEFRAKYAVELGLTK